MFPQYCMHCDIINSFKSTKKLGNYSVAQLSFQPDVEFNSFLSFNDLT